MQIVFWLSLIVLFYTYLGYGLLLLLLTALRPRKARAVAAPTPPLTVVVPAYNEAAVIDAKIRNCLSLTYPVPVHYLFVTDGSTDGTDAVVARYPQVHLLHGPERLGKATAINRAMRQVHTPVVVFTDANSLLHPQSLETLVRPFADDRVGGVSGEKRIAPSATAVGTGERWYWRYESALKKASADFYTLVGAAGELFAIRTALFQPLPPDTVVDDFALSTAVCQQGYRFAYRQEAFAVEAASSTLRDERERKVRISAGNYRFFFSHPSLLNFRRHFRFSFQYVSHRVLRWMVCPLLLPLLFGSNLLLLRTGATFYSVFFWLQCAFYGAALLGWLLLIARRPQRPLLLPYYFLFMVLSQYAGFWRYVSGRQPAAWQKAPRRPLAASAEAEA